MTNYFDRFVSRLEDKQLSVIGGIYCADEFKVVCLDQLDGGVCVGRASENESRRELCPVLSRI